MDRSKILIEEIQFNNTDFSVKPLDIGEYETCHFNRCTFSNSNLSNSSFSDCTFESCDLSMAKLTNTALKDVTFINCKALGVNFNDCNDFLLVLKFEECDLKYSSFQKLNLEKIKFENCQLQESDFTETNLTASVFENCNLDRAVFMNSQLEKADFRTAYHYSINPDHNRIRKAKFSTTGLAGLLDKYDIIID